jgi:hypothetical protein
MNSQLVLTGVLGCENRKDMPRMLDPVQFVLIAIAGWMNERQQQTIEYLREENRLLSLANQTFGVTMQEQARKDLTSLHGSNLSRAHVADDLLS